MTKTILISLLTLIVTAAHAQRLPEGKLNSIRERTVDVIHIKANLEFEFAKGRVFGETSVRFTPLRRIDSVSLDAINLSVKSVRDDRGNPLSYRASSHALNIILTGKPGDTVEVHVVYEATPRSGLYFRPDITNPRHYLVDTYGEGGLHANWLPIYGDVNDKFTSEFLVNVPTPYTVISNGRLVETIMQGEGFTTYHWLQEKPHPGYLIALYVGDYEEGKLAPAFGTIPLSYWTPRGRLKEGETAFRNTTKMVEFFSERFQYRYPWNKYDQIAVPDYSIGAMEHTTVTGHRACVLRDSTAPLDAGPPTFEEYSTDWSSEALISHELAHHWFGDNLTCTNLSYIWLNESFASYAMMLWDEKSLGRDQLLFDVGLAKKHYFNYVNSEHTIRPLEWHHFDNADAIYNEAHTYLKGACVLHMMRNILGDDQFFRAIGQYLHKHEFQNVVSDDLKIAIQEATGENLDWFFRQWITGGGHPIFEVKSTFVPQRKVIDIEVKQIQPIVEGQGLFTLPVSITISTAKKTWTKKVWVKNATDHFVLECDEKPLMVSVDGEGSLVAEIRFDKSADELAFQAQHDALPGRLRAMRQLAERFPVKRTTLETLTKCIQSGNTWADAAEAAELLGIVRTDAALRAVRLPLSASDYRVRKAAVLALRSFGEPAADLLKEIIANDPHTDVVAAAIVALAKIDNELDPQFIRQQMNRTSWYDEITIACLNAFKELANPQALPTIRQYVDGKYHQFVRQAALEAWSECTPEDKELHRLLIQLAMKSTLRIQQRSVEMLGELYVNEAMPVLEEIVRLNFDANLTVGANESLDKSKRVQAK